MDQTTTIPPILRQHVEGAAFLWTQRANMFHDAAMDAQQLGRVDLRLKAHIRATLNSSEAALAEAKRQFDDFPMAGEIFAWMVVALKSRDGELTPFLVQLAKTHRSEWRGASGALAWVGVAVLKDYVDPWSRSPNPIHRWLALTSCSHYRTAPGDQLTKFLSDSDPLVRARALRLLGELGLSDRLHVAQDAISASEDDDIRYWAARSAVLLGDRTRGRDTLRALSEGTSAHADAALELVVVSETGPDLRKWLGQLIRNPARRAAAIAVSGMIDDPAVMEWLLSRLGVPEDAAAATAALRCALPVDLDDTVALEGDPAVMGAGFEEREDGPWAVADRVRVVMEEIKPDSVFESLPRLRRRILAQAVKTPGQVLGEWRHFRPYPAWS